jgi:hypothetical protein
MSAYLAWKYLSHTTPLESSAGSEYDFVINVINIYSLANFATISPTMSSTSVVEALVSCGYLGASPDWPTIAMYFPQDP